MANISLPELRGLAVRVLTASKTSPDTAACVAAALVRADADGIPSHGMARLPIYADQSKCGKVDGFVSPELSETGTAAIRVDARCGFAYPAIDLGLNRAMEMVEPAGVVALAIGNSSHAGVLGHSVERLADAGLAAMAFVNTPAAISPWGGNRALYGTDPIAFACPRPDAPPLVIDLSISKIARGKIKLAADRDEAIPDDWATDADGNPTTDAGKAMRGGSLLPIGDAKGAALALMVELMSAAMTGSQYGYEASSFFDAEGGPPKTGQFFFIFKPECLGGKNAVARIGALMQAITDQPGARIPGQRRFENRKRAETDGVDIPDDLLENLRWRAGG
ncbi:MAG: Ldh family oxidoreductase [Alphaproteobacteria bacterium]|nr:Ldh family oxidoreductase [Alphaproteobacteria bacterium]